MSRVAATNATFNDARAVFKPLARGPCPTDLYERFRWDMAGACVLFRPTARVDHYSSCAPSLAPLWAQFVQKTVTL
jgi:hypothetical protein